MEDMYVIDGFVTVFPNFDEANKFREFYNERYKTYKDDSVIGYIEKSDIKEVRYFDSAEEAYDYSIEPSGYWE